ncbi:MAG: outer membrane protein assembly factor [Bacteroidetes bacterium]|nr:outer membrane protein assembly factor [Bacteroidota bacterium]MCL1969482.1 outer membrane protein assembly factor [Bacteroidota bacterium]
MKKLYLLILASLMLLPLSLLAQTDSEIAEVRLNAEKKTEKKTKKKKEKNPDGVRTGWTFGILPSVAFDADLGFQYGVLSNVYYFGDGSTYPDYMHSFYVEAAYTTKRYGLFRFCYDSKFLIPKHRFSFDATFIPDAMSDFLGYNGYQSVYNDNWRNSKKYSAEEGYKTRAFYKYKRNLLRIAADVSGPIKGKWKWATGIGLLGYWTGSVDIEMLNKGKKDTQKFLDKNHGNSKILPTDIEGLYEKYVKWNIIDSIEATGGIHPYLRAGFVYDSRNKQANASNGMYADAFFTYSAGFGNSAKFNNIKFNTVFQHYVPVYKDYITFAYRAGAQLLVAGNSPFYMDSYLNALYYQRVLYEAVGGANSVRGLIRNRVLADGFGYATAEFRFKVWKFNIKKEHFYIAFNPFCDMGIVLQPNILDKQTVIANIVRYDRGFYLADLDQYIIFDKRELYKPHFGAGIGMKIAMNENFILSVDWAMPIDKRDNASKANIYIKMGYLF